MTDTEKHVQDIVAREEEADKLQIEWAQGHANQAKQPDTSATANADVFAKTVEAFAFITDKLTHHTNPSIRPTGMSPPKWDGQVKNFCSWKRGFGKYLQSAGITKDDDELMYILHSSVLPPRVTATIESCTTMRGHNGVWERLQENM